MLKAVSGVISLSKDEPGKDEQINSVRKQTNAWVAKYRRDSTFAGRPSYGCNPAYLANLPPAKLDIWLCILDLH